MADVDGAWVECYDAASGKYFYGNDITGEVTWEMPAAYAARLPPQSSSSSSPSPWISEYDPTSGAYFYVNTETDETTWEMPPGFGAQTDGLGDLRSEAAGVGVGPKTPLSSKWKRAFAKVRTIVALNAKFKKPSWEKHFDEDSGEFFYHNNVTGKSTWDEPSTLHWAPRVPTSPSNRARQLKSASDREPESAEDDGEDDDDEGKEAAGAEKGEEGEETDRKKKKRKKKKKKKKGGSTQGDAAAEQTKRKTKKKRKKTFDIIPMLEAATAGDVDAMMKIMEEGAAQVATHRGRSLFSGAREAADQAPATPVATKTQSANEKKRKKKKEKKKKKKKPAGGGAGGGAGGKEAKGDGGGGDDDSSGEDSSEDEKPKELSEKAKNVYRVQEFRRKRFAVVINMGHPRSGATALHCACERGQEGAVRQLIELGAELNARDKCMNTPLIVAVSKGHLRCVYILLRAGADPGLRSRWGQTAHDVARYRGYSRISRLLEQGEQEFDVVTLYVDRKWYQVDVHLVRHGKAHRVAIDDTTFYVKTKYRTKAHVHHPELH